MERGQFDWVRKGQEPAMGSVEMAMRVGLRAAKGCLDLLVLVFQFWIFVDIELTLDDLTLRYYHIFHAIRMSLLIYVVDTEAEDKRQCKDICKFQFMFLGSI